MGNTSTRANNADSGTVDGVYKQKEDHFKQIKAHFNSSSSGRSFASLSSHQSTFSVSRPWSRVSRRRWKESTLTLPYESSKTAWPVTQLESFFLPEFPVTASQNEKKFKIITEISKGAFGKVYKAEDLETSRTYALKVLSKSKIIKENSVQQVKDEVHIQRVCGHHPFIVNCTARWQSRRSLYIVSDFVGGGELFDLIRSYVTLPIVLVKLYVAQIALALDFLHNAGVIYRDLKPENILLDDEGSIQLIDFGLSKWLPYGSTTRTICGTLRYMDQYVTEKVNAFSDMLRANQGSGVGQISLEFFQKKPGRWRFQTECTPWEIWTIYLHVIPFSGMENRQRIKERVGVLIAEEVLHITEIMNRHEYLPKMPGQSEIDYIFDTSYPDIQPYLFHLNCSIPGPSGGLSMGSTMKKLLTDHFI